MFDGLEAWLNAPATNGLTLTLVLVFVGWISEALGRLTKEAARTVILLENRLNFVDLMIRENGKQIDHVLSVLRDVESTVSILKRDY